MATRPSEEELAGFSADGTPSAPDEGDETTSESTTEAIGLTTTPLTPTIARQVGVDAAPRGLVITAVDPSSNAAQSLRRGDVLVSAKGEPHREKVGWEPSASGRRDLCGRE